MWFGYYPFRVGSYVDGLNCCHRGNGERGGGSCAYTMFFSWTIATIVTLWGILLAYITHSSDPYGLFHLSLNKLPGENDEEDPKTEWLNMGYWKVSHHENAFSNGVANGHSGY